MYKRQGFRNPPVEVDEELDVKIDAVGEKGDGIAKKDGFVLFVPGVKEGDEVKIKVTKVLRNVGFAEVVGAKDEKTKKETEKPAAEEVPSEEDSSELTEDTEDFGEDLEAKKE